MLIVMMVLFLLLGAIFMFDQPLFRIGANVLVLLTCFLMFYYYGASNGTQAVNHGEIMHTRRETGREVAASELQLCYHPLKGLIGALLGAAPLLLCSVALACIATRQTTGIGMLPSWVMGLENRAEFGEPLSFYGQVVPLGLEGTLRLIIRMSTMPWVNIFDSTNSYAMLTLEHVSPLLQLLPVAAYGLGYCSGPVYRARVHGEIEAGKRKKAKKSKKTALTAQKKEPKINHGPGQLN